MKKFKHIWEIKAEKKHLLQRQQELEKAIQYDWRDVKENFSPGHIAGRFFSNSGTDEEQASGHSIFSESVAQFASVVTRGLVQKLEVKFEKWFKE